MIDSRLAERLHRRANAGRWTLTPAQFAVALERSATHGAGPAPTDAAIERYLSGLHLDDLALACACSEGVDAAWEHFVREFRPALYRAAVAVDSSGGARDLADSIYGDLFGVSERGGARQSLFRYYHGRSSLITWLRAVLAQRQVDRHRDLRRMDPIPDEESPAALAASVREPEPERPRYLHLMASELARAVEALAVRDRLRLACYYAQGLTLAQTGTILKEHEATTSRQLAKTRKTIRDVIEQRLRSSHQLTDDEITRCFESVVEDAGPLDLARILTGA